MGLRVASIPRHGRTFLEYTAPQIERTRGIIHPSPLTCTRRPTSDGAARLRASRHRLEKADEQLLRLPESALARIARIQIPGGERVHVDWGTLEKDEQGGEKAVL